MDHSVQVCHLCLNLRGHLSDVFEHISEDATLISLFGADPGSVTINLRSLGFQTPSGVESHEGGGLSLKLVNVLTAHLIEETLMFFRISSPVILGSNDMLLRRNLLIQHLMLGLLCRFGHEVVLSEHLFSSL